jgi:hypothetical protein
MLISTAIISYAIKFAAHYTVVTLSYSIQNAILRISGRRSVGVESSLPELVEATVGVDTA